MFGVDDRSPTHYIRCLEIIMLDMIPLAGIYSSTVAGIFSVNTIFHDSANMTADIDSSSKTHSTNRRTYI